jgi:hypothetical protein
MGKLKPSTAIQQPWKMLISGAHGRTLMTAGLNQGPATPNPCYRWVKPPIVACSTSYAMKHLIPYAFISGCTPLSTFTNTLYCTIDRSGVKKEASDHVSVNAI